MKRSVWVVRAVLMTGLVATLFASSLPAAPPPPARVLWWDATEQFGGQAPDALRQAMSDYLTAFNAGATFDSTYVSSETPGTLATHLAGNSYDVIVFDVTRFDSTGSAFDAADLAALSAFYASHKNLLMDGVLYIRSIVYDLTTVFPGANGSSGGFTVNEVFQLANRGGGILIGTDHDCCQSDPNKLLSAIIPGAAFTGSTSPSVDGQFNGNDLLDSPALVSAFDLFKHWDAVPSEAIVPIGTFTDVFAQAVTLFSQVDVADDPGGGAKLPYISTSWAPTGSGPAFDCNANGILDSVDIANGTSLDLNANGIPDECDPASTPTPTPTATIAPSSEPPTPTPTATSTPTATATPNSGATEICANGLDDDGNGAIDCADFACCATCAPIDRDPARIRLRPQKGVGHDILSVHGAIIPAGAIAPESEEIGILLTNPAGELLSATLPPGSLSRKGRFRVLFRDRAARDAESGLWELEVRFQPHRGRYQFRLTAYDDLSAATTPDMTLQLRIGDDAFVSHGLWTPETFGWHLDLTGVLPPCGD